jgi:hypothetical protein
MRQPSAHSKDQTGYASEDKTGRVLIRSGLRRKVLALDNALVEVPFRANGDFLYADQLSTGVVTIKLNNTSEDPIPFSAQSMVEDWPIEDVLISCAAQPGLVLNLWYGWRGRIRPPQSVVSLTGSVQLALTAAGAPQGADQIASNGNAYIFTANVGAVAAQFGSVQLNNPNGSGKRVYLDAINFSGLNIATAADYVVQVGATVAGTDKGSGLLKKSPFTANSVAHLRTDVSGGGIAGGIIIDNVGMAAALTQKILYNPPFVLDPNSSVWAQNLNVNQEARATFEWREY